MYFLRGNLEMEIGNYPLAIKLFEDARVKLGSHTHPPPLIVLLVCPPQPQRIKIDPNFC